MQSPLKNLLEGHLNAKLQQQQAMLERVASGRPRFPPPLRVDSPAKTPSTEPPATSPAPAPAAASKNFIRRTGAEDINDYRDESSVTAQKVAELARLIRQAKTCVVYTGAGISTAAKIPDYRSKTGIWTLKEQGVATPDIQLAEARPTAAHYIVAKLVEQGLVKAVVSTNIDGLHRMSGVPPERLCQLHGDAFVERCSNAKCGKTYPRSFSMVKSVDDSRERNHATGRQCTDCGADLLDSIVHFGESLPQAEQETANRLSTQVDLAICIGTSLRVSPACNMPRRALHNGGHLVVINLQKTPFEDETWLHVHSDIDATMTALASELSLPVPSQAGTA